MNLTSGSLTISPGIYSQISVSGTGQLMLDPGVYVIVGGGLSVSGGSVSVATGGPADPNTGTGVLIDNKGVNYPNPGGPYGDITISGGTVNLTGPSTSFFLGTAILQPYDNTQPVVLSGGGVLDLNGAPLYAPAASVSVSGNAQLEQVALVVDQLQIQDSGSVTGLDSGSSTAVALPGPRVIVTGSPSASTTVAAALSPLPPTVTSPGFSRVNTRRSARSSPSARPR